MAERRISELSFNRYWIDLEARSVRSETVACEDVEDLLGGIGRGFKLEQRPPLRDVEHRERKVWHQTSLSGYR